MKGKTVHSTWEEIYFSGFCLLVCFFQLALWLATIDFYMDFKTKSGSYKWNHMESNGIGVSDCWQTSIQGGMFTDGGNSHKAMHALKFYCLCCQNLFLHQLRDIEQNAPNQSIQFGFLGRKMACASGFSHRAPCFRGPSTWQQVSEVWSFSWQSHIPFVDGPHRVHLSFLPSKDTRRLPPSGCWDSCCYGWGGD